MNEGVKDKCEVCQKPAEHKCGACKSAFYCSRQHQRAHWKTHSRKCICYRLETNDVLGRHYVASRRIEVGEIVMRDEKPLIKGPPQETVPVCLGCLVPLTQDTAKPCEQCGWPLCPNCQEHGPECQFTRRHRKNMVSITEFGLSHPTYKCVTIARALALKEADPPAYEKLLGLCSAVDRETVLPELKAITNFMKRFFRTENAFTEEEVIRVAGVLQINAHEVPVTEPAHIAVYELASFFEHSCRANCSKSFTEDGGILIRAAMQIDKGEHLSICYTDPLWGTSNRRHHLQRTKFFECTCKRCSDPLEFGTNFNSVRCLTKTYSHCEGFMAPLSFPVGPAAENYEYVCTTCGSKVTNFAVDQLIESIGRDLAMMKKNDIEACREFLLEQADKLHENHFYMVDVKIALAQMIGQQEGGLPAIERELLSDKILLCKKLEEIISTIAPAENRIRGLLLFEMHAAVAEFGRRSEKDQLFDILSESRRLLQEAYKLLKYEPEVLPEGKIAKAARQNAHDMDIILKTLCQNSFSPT